MPRSDAIRKLEAVKEKIGQITDARVAAEAGVSIGSVRAWRKRHGIPASRGRVAPRTGGGAGKKATGSGETGAKKATRKRASSSKGKASKARKTRGRDLRPRRSKVGALRHLLGVESDGVVAAKAGVTVEAVRMYRRRHAIAGPKAAAAAGPGLPRRRRSALDPFFDLLGTVPDSEIAALAGVTGENVRAYRRRHGIEATWKGARPRKSLARPAPAVSTEAKVVRAPSRATRGTMGFLVTVEGQGDHVVVAKDMAAAVEFAVAATSTEIIAIRTLGPLLVGG